MENFLYIYMYKGILQHLNNVRRFGVFFCFDYDMHNAIFPGQGFHVQRTGSETLDLGR